MGVINTGSKHSKGLGDLDLIRWPGCHGQSNDIVCSGSRKWDTRSRWSILANGYEPNPGGLKRVH